MIDSLPHSALFAAHLLVFLLPYGLKYFVLKDRSGFLDWIVFYRSLGPRTDVRMMSRRQLAQSGVQFLVLSVYSLSLLFLLGTFFNVDGSPKIFLYWNFIFGFLFLMSVCGGVYMLVRSVFKADPA